MKHIVLSALELTAKAKAARTDVADIASLRAIEVPADGASFMVARILFVWMSGDLTADDGDTSVKPLIIPELAAGRYRRVAFDFFSSRRSL